MPGDFEGTGGDSVRVRGNRGERCERIRQVWSTTLYDLDFVRDALAGLDRKCPSLAVSRFSAYANPRIE